MAPFYYLTNCDYCKPIVEISDRYKFQEIWNLLPTGPVGMGHHFQASC